MSSAVCNGITDLSYKLYDILKQKDGNMLYSPFTLHTVLSLAYQGATGTIADNLEKTLAVKGAKKAADGYESLLEAISFLYSVKVYAANKVFAQSSLKEHFTGVATKSFFAEAETIDLGDKDATAAAINSWVAEKTENRISDVVGSTELADSPNLVLVNAINFKGDWLVQFEESDTKKKKFYVSEKDAVDCDMMHASVRLKYCEDIDLESQVMCISYENESTYLMVFLPRERMGINNLETKIQSKSIPKILQNMDFADILLYLPKFKLETKTELQGPLSELGLGALFNNQAEFPDVVDASGPVKGVKIIQKTSLQATEQGTDVGDAGFVFSKGSAQNQRIQYREFNADHPFLFMLMYEEDANRCVLLSGRVVNPTA